MMRVEILEERLSDTDPDTERHHMFVKGDVVTVPDTLGTRWCAYGWAKDMDGVQQTGERIPGPRALDVQSAKVAARRPAPAIARGQ